jgi:hypothetical protein
MVCVGDVNKGASNARFGDDFQGIMKAFQKNELFDKTCER